MPDPWRDIFQPALADRGLALSPEQEQRFARYAALVLEKNRSFNLTAAQDQTELVRRHLLDGLAALAPLRAKFAGAAPSAADVGAGAGFIGLSLKIAWPELRMTLVESVRKKAAFIEWAAEKLGLEGVTVAAERADALARAGRDFDAVLERALAPLPQALKICLPLARPGGRFFAFQSEPMQGPEVAGLEDSVRYLLPGEAKPRYLLCFLKQK